MNLFRSIASVLADLRNLVNPPSFYIENYPFMPQLERDFLENSILVSRSILEFGSGGSTAYAASKSKAIVSVESDRRFHVELGRYFDINFPNSGSQLVYANVGATGRYGVPIFYPLCSGISDKGLVYVLEGYTRFSMERPDLVFVDGRWRVACCLYSLVLGWSDVCVVLDDYEDWRGYSRFIEKYFNVRLIGRLAVLARKQDFDVQELVQDFCKSLADPG